jgi:hypothetical protein
MLLSVQELLVVRKKFVTIDRNELLKINKSGEENIMALLAWGRPFSIATNQYACY